MAWNNRTLLQIIGFVRKQQVLPKNQILVVKFEDLMDKERRYATSMQLSDDIDDQTSRSIL